MSGFNLEIDYRTAVLGRIVQSVGLAFLFVPISAMAFAFIPRERTNYATGLFNLARNIGGSSGIATVTTLLARRSQLHQQILVAHLTPYDAPYREALARTTALVHAHGSSLPDAAAQAQRPALWKHAAPVRHAGVLRRFLGDGRVVSGYHPVDVFNEEIGPVQGPIVGGMKKGTNQWLHYRKR